MLIAMICRICLRASRLAVYLARQIIPAPLSFFAAISMNPDWQTYLRTQCAVIKNQHAAHFGDIAAERAAVLHETIVADLSTSGLIKFSGSDAAMFLQSQLSCDVREIDAQTARYGSYCTPKGRILANFTLWRQADDFLMQLPAGLSASIRKRLSMFVLRAKVQLADIGDEWVQIGVAGAGVATAVEKAVSCACSGEQSLIVCNSGKNQILRLAPNRFLLIAPAVDAPALWQQLRLHARPVGVSCWEWLTIQAGIPVVLPETQEAFIPQMINLDALGGVGFKKGCYPGQEIVARTQYLGTLKRRMVLAHIDTSESVNAGDPLYSADMADQSSGTVVNAAPSPHGGTDALAVIQLSNLATGSVHWSSPQGPVLAVKPLPYPVDR